jgi:pimeloyl-ACP methyl ester carboxylesterase
MAVSRLWHRHGMLRPRATGPVDGSGGMPYAPRTLRGWRSLQAVVAAGLLATGVAAAEPVAEIVTLQVRDGATQSFLLVADPSVAVEQVVVLFSGGAGNVRLRAASLRPAFAERGNFLVRTRYRWAEGGFASAVVDAPSDRAELGLDDTFRSGRTHAEDIGKVVADLRRRFPNAQVTLVGTSRGTVSAASVAGHLQGQVDRVVLTATLFNASRGGAGLSGFDYRTIKVPLLFVHHVDDACPATPYATARRLSSAWPLVSVSGGHAPESGPCDPLAPHGFFGREAETVAAVKAWIRGGTFPAQVP